jgi:hypothetical protein
MRLAMKSLSLLGAALLLSGLVLCNFGAQASGCLAWAQFPDQTIFRMGQIQSGTNKGWVIFISNPKWNPWIGKKETASIVGCDN